MLDIAITFLTVALLLLCTITVVGTIYAIIRYVKVSRMHTIIHNIKDIHDA